MAFDAATIQIFRDEAIERLETLEADLLLLDPVAPDPDRIDSAFRALHTIKGSGAMYGFDRLVEAAHLAESLFSRLRDGSLPLTQDIIDLGLKLKDHLVRLVPGRDAGEAELEASEEVVHAIAAILPPLHRPAPASAAAPANSGNNGGGRPARWRVRFCPSARLFKSGTNPLQLIKETADLGRLEISASVGGIPALEELDPENCHLSWEMVLETTYPETAIRDVYIFVEGEAALSVERLEAPGTVAAGPVPAATKPGREAPGRREREAVSTIKVPVRKLDDMVNLAGELVTLQSRYRQLAEDRGDAELGELNENLESLIRHLRGLAMEMHMVPLEVLFAGYQRLVHDLCRQLGKQAVLETTGTETELEKNIIEELRDPLLHLIRNAMDHGIESPAGREAAGKDPIGRLRLSARCEGGSVLITVEDDGAGMDLAAIARKAVERKLIASAASMDAAAIRQLVFLPGFSTAATVSAVSGRGVGMDVVKRSVEGLRGGIRLEDRPGGGTRVQLRIPLSLTVIEALILRIGGDSYAINLAAIRECRNLASLTGLARGGTVVYGGRPAACIDLGRFFDPAAAPRREGVVVLVGDGRKTVGLLVDEVRHTVQAVIKPLGRSFAASRGVNGAVVLGDGSLALVIDAEHFLEMGGPGN